MDTSGRSKKLDTVCESFVGRFASGRASQNSPSAMAWSYRRKSSSNRSTKLKPHLPMHTSKSRTWLACGCLARRILEAPGHCRQAVFEAVGRTRDPFIPRSDSLDLFVKEVISGGHFWRSFPEVWELLTSVDKLVSQDRSLASHSRLATPSDGWNAVARLLA